MKVLYAKINNHRRPPFRISTRIVEDGDRRCVEKRALTPEAIGHLRSIRWGYDRLQESLAGEGFRLPEILASGDACLRFAYVEGKGLDEVLLQRVLAGDRAGFFRILDDYGERLRHAFRTVDHFLPAEDATPLFAGVSRTTLEGAGPFFYHSFLDPIFENVLVRENAWFLIDNEWVFPGCLPVSYAFFRSLLIFYKAKYGFLGVEDFAPYEEVLRRYGISEDLQKVYHLIETNFQRYVDGPCSEVTRYKLPYRKKRASLDELVAFRDDTLRSRSRYAQLYLDTGLGINEAQSLRQPLSGEEGAVEFDLAGFREIRSVRFDPVNDHAAIFLREIVVVAADGQRHALAPGNANALFREGGNMVFFTTDPQIRIDLQGIAEPRRLSVRLDYVAMGSDVFGHVLAWERRLRAEAEEREAAAAAEQATVIAAVRSELGEIRSELAAVRSELAVDQAELDALRGEILHREQVIALMEQSLSWRITKPLRRIKRLFRPDEAP